jgi:hypothetical protein
MRQGVRLVELLRRHRDQFPHFATHLDQFCERVMTDAQRTREGDRARVLSALREWSEGLAMDEILEDTSLSHWDARTILADLIKRGLVRQRLADPDLGRASRIIYFLC